MINEIEVNYEEIIGARKDTSPIWYAKIEYKVLKSLKTVKKSYTHHTSPKIVCKGTIEEILKAQDVKKRVASSYLFEGSKVVHKKLEAFDLNRITLKSVKIDHFKGYGIKRK